MEFHCIYSYSVRISDWAACSPDLSRSGQPTESRLRTERADSTATHLQFLDQARAAETEVKRLTAQVEDMRNGQTPASCQDTRRKHDVSELCRSLSQASSAPIS